MASKTLQSTFGTFTLVASEEGLQRIAFGPSESSSEDSAKDRSSAIAQQAAEELEAYLNGELKHWSVPLDLNGSGTNFQQEVWQELLNIPYGETRSYSEIACKIGKPNAVRAIGQANHRNPLPIVIPCHRVIGQNGSMTGYGGGIPLKEKLLELENPQRSIGI